jgi:hypothetical protein
MKPSTTLADLFMLRLCTDPPSAVRATLRRQLSDELDDGVTHGWQAWLRRRSLVSFFPPHFFEATMLEVGEGEHRHERMTVKTLSLRSALVPNSGLPIIILAFNYDPIAIGRALINDK